MTRRLTVTIDLDDLPSRIAESIIISARAIGHDVPADVARHAAADVVQVMALQEADDTHALLRRALAAAERGSNWIGATQFRVDDSEHKRISVEIIDEVRAIESALAALKDTP